MTRPPLRIVAAAVAIGVGLVTANFAGRELNTLFLRYPGIDKAMHVTVYAIIFTVIRWIATTMRLEAGRIPLVAAAVTLAVAFADEAVQSLFPGRQVERLDIAANVAGAAIGLAFAFTGTRRLAVAAVALAAGAAITYHTHMRLQDFSQGLMHERAHRFAEARRYYLRALDAGVRTPGLLNSLGWVEIESGEGDARRAVEYAAAALALRPDDPDILDTYGWALHHAGRHEEARAALERAYADAPDMFCIDYHLGSVYRALGRAEAAGDHFRRQMRKTKTREARLAARALADLEGRQ
jgi:tetratricopeptide (TPR) repeat protein